MMAYYQIDLEENISTKFCLKFKVCIQEIAFKNVVCNMAAILSRPQCVNQCSAEIISDRKNERYLHLLAFINTETLRSLKSFAMWNQDPGDCFTNISQALQNILQKFVYWQNHTYEFQAETNCSPALGTHTKFQLEIININVISGIVYFREIILESSQNVSENNPLVILYSHYCGCWCPGDVRSHSIRRYRIDLVLWYYSGFNTMRVNAQVFTCMTFDVSINYMLCTDSE